MLRWLCRAQLVISQGLFHAVLTSYTEMLGQWDQHSDPNSYKHKLKNHTTV